MGDCYSPTEVDIESKEGNCGGGNPRDPDGSSNRHASAWEEVKPAFDQVCLCLDICADCLVSLGCASGAEIKTITPEIRQLAEESKMPRVRGE